MTIIMFLSSLVVLYQYLPLPSFFLFSSSLFCKFSLPSNFYFMSLLSFSSASLYLFVSYLIHCPPLLLLQRFSVIARFWGWVWQVVTVMVVCLTSVRNEKFALGYQFHKSPWLDWVRLPDPLLLYPKLFSCLSLWIF